MEYINFTLPVWEWWLLGMALIAGLVGLSTGFLPLRIVKRNREPEEGKITKGPKVSIIALSSNDTDPSDFIAQATQQCYEDYEVIIVHESTANAHEVFAERYAWVRPEPAVLEVSESDGAEEKTDGTEIQPEPLTCGCTAVKFCFYPPGAHAISIKKLALSIGIKAADGNVVLTTTTSCLITSRYWLSAMMRHWKKDVDFVLGYAHLNYNALPNSRRPLDRFIQLMTTAQWMTEVLNDKPIRGDGYNMAYRKEIFYKSKGFAQTNDLMNGEDDIFVAANARAGNAKLELSEASTLYPEYGDETARIFSDARDHYRFTAMRLPRGAYIRQGVASLCQWLMLCGVVVAAILGMPNVVPGAIGLVVLLGVWLWQAIIYKNVARNLGDSRKWWLTPILLMARPIDNFMFDINHHDRRFTNYTLRRQ